MLTVTDDNEREYLLNFDTPGKILLIRNGRPTRLFVVKIVRWTGDSFDHRRVIPPRFPQLERDLQSVFDRIARVTCDKEVIPSEFLIEFNSHDHIRILGYEDVIHVKFYF